MIRLFVMLLGLACIAICLSEVVVLAALWQKGYLTEENITAARDIFSGRTADLPQAPATDVPTQPNVDEVLHERSIRILQLEARERELDVLRNLAAEEAESLLKRKDKLEQSEQQFDERLAALEEQLAADSVEQTRLVLLALPPEEAATRLMALSLDENVHLLKGVPEKSIARILQGFGPEPEQQTRVQEIFAALLRGDPQRTLIEATRRELGEPVNEE